MSESAARSRLRAFDDRAALAKGAADLIVEALRSGGRFAASGGSTPAPIYENLRERDLDWSRIEVTLSDERWVAPTSPDSNERMLREHLLRGPAAEARFVPLNAHAEEVDAAAAIVEPRIAPLLPFDMALLGMGDDGHFASLFPGSPALKLGLDPEGDRLCIGVPAGAPMPPQPRISMTLRALMTSRTVLLLITGQTKRDVLERALGGADLPVGALLLQDRAPVHIYWSP